MPAAIERLVYLDSAPARDGASVFDLSPPEHRARVEEQASLHGDGWRWPLPPPDQLARISSTAGIVPRDMMWFRDRAEPQPLATLAQPARLTNAAATEWIPRTLILCTAGRFTARQLAEAIAQGRPMAAPFKEGAWEFREIPTGHWPMFSAPQAVAETLLDVVRPAEPERRRARRR
jgi:hypothetical protein